MRTETKKKEAELLSRIEELKNQLDESHKQETIAEGFPKYTEELLAQLEASKENEMRLSNEIEQMTMEESKREFELLAQGGEKKCKDLMAEAKRRKAELLIQISTGVNLPSDIAGKFTPNAEISLNEDVSAYAGDLISEAKSVEKIRSGKTKTDKITATDVSDAKKHVCIKMSKKVKNDKKMLFFEMPMLIASVFIGVGASNFEHIWGQVLVCTLLFTNIVLLILRNLFSSTESWIRRWFDR